MCFLLSMHAVICYRSAHIFVRNMTIFIYFMAKCSFYDLVVLFCFIKMHKCVNTCFKIPPKNIEDHHIHDTTLWCKRWRNKGSAHLDP